MNVIVIICDQLRFDAIGFNGNPYTNTPNINRLAEKSVNFINAFSQAPACSPARHSMATGKYPHRHGVVTNHSFPHPGMRTLAHELKPLGYRRLQIGFMHWKGNEDHGFELIDYSGFDNEVLTQKEIERRKWEEQGITKRTTAGPSPFKKEDYSGYKVAVTCAEQLEELVERGEKFLCWNCIRQPHPPFYPPKDIYEKIDQSILPLPSEVPQGAPEPHPTVREKQKEWSHLTRVEKRQIKAGYYGMVELADYYVGIILSAMDKLNLWENTMVIFTADHGEQLGEHNLYSKFVFREASLHIPFMIYHPHVEPGEREQFAEQVDIFPTICDYLGVQIPKDLDGRSLRPVLENGIIDDWRSEVIAVYGNDRMIRTKEWKLNMYDGVPGELYNLKEDPNEFYNLIKRPEYDNIIKDLMKRLD